MELSHDLVDQVQLVDWQVLQPRVLSSLAIDLQQDVLPLEPIGSDHVLQGLELLLEFALSRGLPNADIVEATVVLVGRTFRLFAVGAIVLRVDHLLQGADLTAEVVDAVDPDVD